VNRVSLGYSTGRHVSRGCCAVTFRERQVIGTTSLTPQEVQDAVQEMGDVYKGNAYHLLQRCVDQHVVLHACIKVSCALCVYKKSCHHLSAHQHMH
jgi:hypothetical protein